MGERLRVRHADLDDVPGCALEPPVLRARLGFVEIPRENLRPELAAVVSEEAHRGLDPHTRVIMGIDAGRLPFVNDVPRSLSSDRFLSLVSISALATSVGRDLEAVST